MSFWKKAKKVDAPTQDSVVDRPSAVRRSLNELVLQSIHEGVIIVNPDGNITLTNPAACELIGHDADEIDNVFYDSVINLLDKTGNRISESRNPINIALKKKEYVHVENIL